MEDRNRDQSWIAGATGGIMNSLSSIRSHLGTLAERLDEFGVDFLGHVDLSDDPAATDLNAATSEPFVDITRPRTAANSMNLGLLPIEVQHLIIVQMLPSLEELASVSLVNRSWYWLSRDIQVWNAIYAKGLSEWSFLEGPLIRQPDARPISPNASSSSISEKRKNAWFWSSKASLITDLTSHIFSKIEAFSSSSLRAQQNENEEEATDEHESQQSMAITSTGEPKSWWMSRYLKQSRWNTPRMVQFEVSLPNPSSLLSRIIQPPIITIPVFGPGVGSAQKAMYDLAGRVTHNVTMHAGVRGIGAGIGFNIGGVVYKLSAIHEPPQPFHTIITQDATWRALFASAGFLMYAVSHKVSLADSKIDFQSFLALDFDAPPAPAMQQPQQNPDQNQHAAPAPQAQAIPAPAPSSPRPHSPRRKTPLLVLSFIRDKSISQVAEELGLTELPDDHLWAIKAIDPEHKARDMLFCLKWLQSSP